MADAAAGSDDQHRVARLEAELIEPLQRRDACHRQPSGLARREAPGNPGGVALVDGGVLGEEAALLVSKPPAIDAITGRELRHLGTDGLDGARSVCAEDRGQLAPRVAERAVDERRLP